MLMLIATKCGRSQGQEDLFQDLQVQNQVMHWRHFQGISADETKIQGTTANSLV